MFPYMIFLSYTFFSQGPKQLDGVMCGYFFMRYMRDIIANISLLTSQVH